MNFDDKAFIKTIEKLIIPPSDFDHLAHLRLAYAYLLQYDIETAQKKVKKTIIN